MMLECIRKDEVKKCKRKVYVARLYVRCSRQIFRRSHRYLLVCALRQDLSSNQFFFLEIRLLVADYLFPIPECSSFYRKLALICKPFNSVKRRLTGSSNTPSPHRYARTHEPPPDLQINIGFNSSLSSRAHFFSLLSPLFIFEAMRLLSLPACGPILITILFSDYACARPKIVVSRECESAWCANVPSLPWDALLGAGSATVRAFEGILNGFVKPQSPTSPPLTTNDVGDDADEGSDERAWLNLNMESGLPGRGQDQCRNNLPDLQPGEVSFFFAFAVSVPLIRG